MRILVVDNNVELCRLLRILCHPRRLNHGGEAHDGNKLWPSSGNWRPTWLSWTSPCPTWTA